jgi:Putative beta-barrel porin-2, OmpL-like. bbp2
MLQKLLVAAIGLLSFTFSTAQTASVSYNTADSTAATNEEQKKEPALTITGSVDAYYKYDFNNPKNYPYNSPISFTKSQNSFELGMINVKIEHQSKKWDMVADLGFGKRETEFAYNDNGLPQAIKQLYISYSPASWLKLTGGSWATHCNWELADAYANRNYSMSYQFTIGPFSHTGVRADITFGKNGFMLGAANATDYRAAPDGRINKKFLLAQYTYAPTDNLKFYLNYVGGQAPDTSKSNFFNLIATAKFSDKFNIVYNGIYTGVKQWNGQKNIASKSWWGSAVYLNFDPKKWLGLTLREEYFNDDQQLNLFAATATGGSLFSTTLSANFKTGGFIFIPEFRLDNTNKEVLFTSKSGAFTKSATSFLIAAVYSF